MLNVQISLKRQGKENVKHKPVIEKEDLAKLIASRAIAVTNPLSLLWNVWFHVVLFFIREEEKGKGSSKDWVLNLKQMPLEEGSSQWHMMR